MFSVIKYNNFYEYIIKEVLENCTDSTVDFSITFSKGKLAELLGTTHEHGVNGLEKLLKLCSTSSTTNMNLFNSDDKLTKYDSVEEIIDDYFSLCQVEELSICR